MTQEVKSKAPLSGYAIERVYMLEQSLKTISRNQLPLPKESDVSFGWDWRHLKPGVFEVKLILGLEPDTSHPFTAWVTTVGTFQVSGSPKVPVEEFVRLQAVAILLPYARQYLANLTVNTLSGACHLPSLDVQDMMTQFDPNKTTGARQMREGKTSLLPEPSPTRSDKKLRLKEPTKRPSRRKS
jgi:preprotein translocase subunit SecB